MTDYPGINYGIWNSNIDLETGIRYGVIPQNYVLQAWADSSEGYYGEPTCPKCGDEAGSTVEFLSDCRSYGGECNHDWVDDNTDYICTKCEYTFNDDEAYSEEVLSWELDDGEYKCVAGDDGDIFILKSPYYTYAQYCSPCAAGAGYLTHTYGESESAHLLSSADYRKEAEEAVFPKVYCFHFDWFDDDALEDISPYRIFRVDNDEEVLSKA